jgi:hypothetical protein
MARGETITMIVYKFKNLKTGVVYEDVLRTRDIKKLLNNPNIVMQPVREVSHSKRQQANGEPYVSG